MNSKRKPAGYGDNPEDIKAEIEKMWKEHPELKGRLPSLSWMNEHGYGGLVSAVNRYHGGIEEVRKRLYWENGDNTRAEIEKMWEEHPELKGKFPSSTWLFNHGYSLSGQCIREELKTSPQSLEAKLTREFFCRDAETVARDLLGRNVVRQLEGNRIIRGRLKEISAYEGKVKSTSKVIDYLPGTIGINAKYGKYMINVSTKSEGPSCIVLIAAEFDEAGRKRFVQGPSKVCEELGVDKRYDNKSVEETDFWFEAGLPVDPESIRIRTKSNAPDNCKGYFYVP